MLQFFDNFTRRSIEVIGANEDIFAIMLEKIPTNEGTTIVDQRGSICLNGDYKIIF